MGPDQTKPSVLDGWRTCQHAADVLITERIYSVGWALGIQRGQGRWQARAVKTREYCNTVLLYKHLIHFWETGG